MNNDDNIHSEHGIDRKGITQFTSSFFNENTLTDIILLLLTFKYYNKVK